MALIYAQRGRFGSTDGGVVQPSQFQAEGVTYTGRRPCFVWFRGDLYIIGSYTRPIVRHSAEPSRFRIAGIRPPQVQLAVAPGASTGGSSGACLAAITFVHKAAGRVLAESNFSNVVNVGELTGEGRAWSSIDSLTAESRVTHVRGYVSMNGASFRMAWESPYGLTSYVENVRTLALTFIGPELYDHRVPPATLFGHAWVGRMWYANSPQRPYRVWFSNIGEPQYVGKANFRDTLDRERITAIWKGRHELVVFCERSSYMIRSASGQPGSDDFVMEKLDSDWGCINHFGIWEVHNRLWFPGEDGIGIYDGGFHYLMKEIQPLWRDDSGFGDMNPNGPDHREEFRNGFAMVDKQNKVYMYATNRTDRGEFENTGFFPGTITYAGYYGMFEPSMAGDARHPEWTLDMKDRYDSVGFYNRDGELVIGSCDGKIRKQDKTVGGDDGDLMGKPCLIRTGHQFFFEPGDELEMGKQLLQLWAYVESESTAWAIHIRGGDEQAWQSQLPDNDFFFWKLDVAASALQETRTVRGRNPNDVPRTMLMKYVPDTVHTMTPAEKVTGSGFTFEFRATGPIGLEYRGYGGMYGKGPQARGTKNVTRYVISLLEISEDTFTWTAIDPGDTVTVTGCPKTIYFRVTLAYEFGSAAFPITVTLTGAGASPITETVVLAGPGLVATTDGATLAVGTLGLSIAALDANNVPLTGLLYPVTLVGAA